LKKLLKKNQNINIIGINFMKICFVDFTNFKYSFEDKHLPILRGAETMLINLSYNLKDFDNEIYVFNNCSKNYKEKNYNWLDYSDINKLNYTFDVAICNGDINLLNHIKAKKKFAISWSIQSIEKFIRKKQLFSYFKNKPKMILGGKYHKSKRSYITRIFGYDYYNPSIDKIFLKEKLDNSCDKSKAIFTSRSDRNMKLLTDLWKNKIYPINNKFKLFVTPYKNSENLERYNIFYRKMGTQHDLIKDLKNSRIMLMPGHKAELFCLAAEEARELCVPIVTLGIGSLSERVEHDVTGLIAKNNDEFIYYTLKLFNEDILWNKFRKNLINLRGKTNWIHSTKLFLNVLKK